MFGKNLFSESGIAFVASRNNFAELPKIVELARRFSVKKISVSNLLAYTESLKENILYQHCQQTWPQETALPILPPMDCNDATAPIVNLLAAQIGCAAWTARDPSAARDVCPFIERGSMSIRWDGKISPCWPLLYTHDSYLGDRRRHSTEFFVGSVLEQSIRQIWEDPSYVKLRQKISTFPFAPCTQCNNCELADHNQEDCICNQHPACGGCLWSQGFIVCP